MPRCYGRFDVDDDYCMFCCPFSYDCEYATYDDDFYYWWDEYWY